MDDIEDYDNELNQEMFNRDENTSIGHQMYQMLKGRQLEFVNEILNACTNQQTASRCYFLDGPGGTGKSFVYKTLYHILTGRNFKVKCMAFTGIASILLPNGSTSHKTFGLQVPLTSQSKSNILPRIIKNERLLNSTFFSWTKLPCYQSMS